MPSRIRRQNPCDTRNGGDIIASRKDGLTMRKHSDFTQEEMRILKENPNTAKLTENRISLTLDAKQKS